MLLKRKICEGTNNVMEVGEDVTGKFWTREGLRQGCVLSPILFTIKEKFYICNNSTITFYSPKIYFELNCVFHNNEKSVIQLFLLFSHEKFLFAFTQTIRNSFIFVCYFFNKLQTRTAWLFINVI